MYTGKLLITNDKTSYYELDYTFLDKFKLKTTVQKAKSPQELCDILNREPSGDYEIYEDADLMTVFLNKKPFHDIGLPEYLVAIKKGIYDNILDTNSVIEAADDIELATELHLRGYNVSKK